jgi:prepilin-type N-terminal cleavage/methylation domain-containing protein
MQGRILRRRTRARRSAGYTLIELMVVVVLIALLAMIAAPSMVRARSDRLAFAFARDVSGAIHSARTRAAGRGAAHLVLYLQSTSSGDRGTVVIFEALDGTNAGSNPAGPNPSSSCRRPNQWAYASTWAPSAAADPANFAAVVEGVTANSNGNAGEVVEQENIRMKARFSTLGSATAPVDVTGAFAMCITPNGTTYYGSGASASAAITAMQQSTQPFVDIVEVDVARHAAGASNPPIVGLNRRVIVAGSSAPRIKSE